MTAIELNARKAIVVREILNNINSAELLDRLSTFVYQLIKKEPCQYSLEEIDKILDEGEIAMENGEGLSSDEVFESIEKKYPYLCK